MVAAIATGPRSHCLFGTSAASSKLDRTIFPHPFWHNLSVAILAQAF